MTRFTIDQEYVFVRTLFERPENDSFRYGLYYVPGVDKLLKIETIKLTCTEHHKVAWDQDPDGKKEHEGFVFKDKDGIIWHNQYPTACYGQLDDTNDRIVNKHFETEELLVVDPETKEVLSDEDGRSIRKPGTDTLWEEFDSQFMNPFVLATSTLSDVYRAINPRKNRTYNLAEDKKPLYQEYLGKLIIQVEQASGKEVVFKPVVMKFTDGREAIVTDFMRAELV